MEPNRAPIHLIFVVLAIVMFGLAAFVGPWNIPAGQPDSWYRGRLIAAGLFLVDKHVLLMKTHRIEFSPGKRPREVNLKCSCGYEDTALSRKDAYRLAQKHIDIERAKEVAE